MKFAIKRTPDVISKLLNLGYTKLPTLNEKLNKDYPYIVFLEK